MHWKYLVVIIIVVVVSGIFLFKNTYNLEQDMNFEEFINDDNTKLKNVIISKEIFDGIEIPGYILFYFPNDCPDYKEDIFLIEKTIHGDKYYLPEKNSLIKLINFEWSKEFKNFWFNDQR